MRGLALPRDRLAMWFGLATVLGLGAALLFTKGTQLLMPGPLSSVHGATESCNACHAKSGGGKLSWIGGLLPGDPHADSKACLTCHTMPDTAFNAHGASVDVLRQSTERLTKVAARISVPKSARAQTIAFPTQKMAARGLECATCHQEHQGASFKLSEISNEQCRSCHVVKFDSFDGDHPKFENYPFKRRTRIIYDHAGHFKKHYLEVAKKDPTRRIPETCSTCHNSRDDKRVMSVAPFEKTCASCHLDQIVGKERASGPKGIAFLSLPGLDLQALETKKAQIGEWPDASEAELTPFMKVMIAGSARGRALIKAVDGVNLLDLANASADQIEAVTGLVWEIKSLFYGLIRGKASDVLGDLNIGDGATLSASLVADLTASIPRDVLESAQQQWLPNLAAEMANRPVVPEVHDTNGWGAVTKGSRREPPSASGIGFDGAAPQPDRSAGSQPTPRVEGAAAVEPTASGEPGTRGRVTRQLPAPMRAGAGDAQVRSVAETGSAQTDDGPTGLAAEESGGGAVRRIPLPSGTPRSLNAGSADDETQVEPNDAGKATVRGTKPERPADDRPPTAAAAGGTDDKTPPQSEDSEAKSNAVDANAEGGNQQPHGDATKQSDDLLYPTQEELRAIDTGDVDAAKTAAPEKSVGASEPAATTPAGAKSAAELSETGASVPASSPANSEPTASAPRSRVAPEISIVSDVDPESWAEYGGWYRQDYAILYRPTGHKDKFIYSWLFLTGPQAPKGDASPAAAVFDSLTSKDAQGACTKCHSVDDIRGKRRLVNFTPPSVATKQGRFTSFIHEPHFGVMENRGCLTCHNLEKGRPYLKSYEQGNPQSFASNFSMVKKDLCQSCHTSGMARQDCLACHKYHVNDVITPIINTRLPNQ